jgi:hypothetical protein
MQNTEEAPPAQGAVGQCAVCKKQEYVTPLHGDKGGPRCCFMCAGAWQAKNTKKRNIGRIAVRALVAFMDAGGTASEVVKLKDTVLMRSIGFGGLDVESITDPLGYLAGIAKANDKEEVLLTTEVLTDAIRLAHPDLHPPERQEIAHRTTQKLLALQPFVFPAPKPKPVQPVTATTRGHDEPARKPLRDAYPCPDCRATISTYYCDSCRTKWNEQRQKERDREKAQRRRWYENRKRRLEMRKKPVPCACCGDLFKGKRRDSRFCSDRCRQQAHRSVTDKGGFPENPQTAVTGLHRRSSRIKPQLAPNIQIAVTPPEPAAPR